MDNDKKVDTFAIKTLRKLADGVFRKEMDKQNERPYSPHFFTKKDDNNKPVKTVEQKESGHWQYFVGNNISDGLAKPPIPPYEERIAQKNKDGEDTPPSPGRSL